MGYSLTIAEYNYSSWSLRAWLLLRHVGIQFDEKKIKLNGPGTVSEEAQKVSPSGRVPLFEYDGRLVWESLAIGELLAELFPSAQLWPRDRHERARARAVSTEMATGFSALRTALPMNIRARVKHGPLDDATKRDIARVQKIWRDFVTESGGPHLSGPGFTITDAMYAPVVTRFRSYGVEVDDVCAKYMQKIEAHPAMKAWCDRAQTEEHRIPAYDAIAAALEPQ